jgi:Porphyromonas-type peptidyl-arginine deiminase subfamily protein
VKKLLKPTILLSTLLAKHHSKIAARLCQMFDRHGVCYEFLQTKDIWMRDFMPFLLDDGRLVSYYYDPDYLKDDQYSHLRTKIQPLSDHINLVLDGGNFVRLGSKAIMTDKIFIENPSKTKTEIIEIIKQKCALNELIIIPRQPYDMLGHSDGMVRWIDESTVLVNDFSNESKSFNESIIKTLTRRGLEIKFMKYGSGFFTKKRDWGAYLNFIKIKDILIVPIYGIDDDDAAIAQIKKIYSGCSVETINLREIIELGGALHCITAEKFGR